MRPPAGPASAAQGTSDKPQDDGLESRGIGRRASLPRRESPPGARSARLGSPARLRGRALAPAQLEVGSRQARKPSSFSLVFHTFYTDFWTQLMGIPLRGGEEPSKPATETVPHPRNWHMNMSRMTPLCENLHRAVAAGRLWTEIAADLRRSRGRFLNRAAPESQPLGRRQFP